jgi:hypothetical protein
MYFYVYHGEDPAGQRYPQTAKFNGLYRWKIFIEETPPSLASRLLIYGNMTE